MTSNIVSSTYVVVGGGIAGVTCVESLAILHPEASVTLVTASSLVKNVSNVSFFAKTIIKFDVNETEASALNRIHPSLHIVYDSIKHLDTTSKSITTHRNVIVHYKYVCLCTGGIPKLISDAKNCERILGIRDTDSVKEFQKRLANGRRMVIVGNGGIASEIVHATKGIQKVWVIKDDYISSTFVDPGAAEFFQDTLRSTTEPPTQTILRRQIFSEEDTVVSAAKNMKSAALGPDWFRKLDSNTGKGEEDLKIIYKKEIRSVAETPDCEWPLKVTLSDGNTVECDFIVSATGVEPAINFTIDKNIVRGFDGGLAVSEMQETSVTDVFAAGDVVHTSWSPAPHWFQMRLWTQARQMGSMAAKAMHARETGEETLQDFCFELFTHATTLYGYQVGNLRLDTSRNPPVLTQCEEELTNKLRKSQCFVVLLGKYNGQGLGDSYEILLRTTPKMEYIKFVLKNDRLQGAILIGDTGLEEMCENLILNQLDLSPFGDDILNPDIDIDDYFD